MEIKLNNSRILSTNVCKIINNYLLFKKRIFTDELIEFTKEIKSDLDDEHLDISCCRPTYDRHTFSWMLLPELVPSI
jgi:hypothetical protein